MRSTMEPLQNWTSGVSPGWSWALWRHSSGSTILPLSVRTAFRAGRKRCFARRQGMATENSPPFQQWEWSVLTRASPARGERGSPGPFARSNPGGAKGRLFALAAVLRLSGLALFPDNRARRNMARKGESPRERSQAKAEQITAEELGRLGWTEADLEKKANSDPDKQALTARLRRETTLSLQRDCVSF